MIKSLDKHIQNGVDRGLLQKFTSSDSLNSTRLAIDDNEYINFGSCSYLGLEYHPKLKQSVSEAVDKYGTQFSTSRTYLSIGLYRDLESEFSKIYEKPVIVTASTTLGHLATLPIIVEEGDAVILDLQVHSSVQMTAQMLKANKIPVHLIPHNDMEALETKIKTVSATAKRIWYLADGIYSMYGDYAPLQRLESLLNQYEKFYLYIDDAHGSSWTGSNGIGYVRSQIKHHDKMVLAISLNKSFASSGGLMVYPNEKMMQKVRNCGATLIFSGPIQPPMLGAAIASAKLHQSTEGQALQKELKEKITYTNKRLCELELPQYMKTDSPVFFIPVGLPNIVITVIKRMKKQGFYINSASFPATPIKRGGLRFMITNNHSYEQIEAMLTTLQREYILGLHSDGSSPDKVAKVFKIPSFLQEHQIELSKDNISIGLQQETSSTITSFSKDQWDSYFESYGSNAYDKLKRLENIFQNQTEIQNNWTFYYQCIKDSKGTPILYAVSTVSVMMDDMLADVTVSEKVKNLRKSNPYYLTSKTLLTGTPFSKGRSVYINYEHDDWKEAVKLHTDYLQEIADEEQVSKIIIRDFDQTQKEKLDAYLMELGFMDLEFPNNCVVDNQNWKNTEDLLALLPQKYRYSLRKEILKKETDFVVNFDRPTTPEMRAHVYRLYQNVHQKASEISVFELPYDLFEDMYEDPSYDFVHVYLSDQSQTLPDGTMISQRIGNTYHVQLFGVDSTIPIEKGIYKQALYQSVKRAQTLGCLKVDLAYTAEMEKKKVGAIPEKNYGFVMALEHDSFQEMELLK